MSDARTFLAEALGVPADALPDAPRLGEPAAWDSIGHMRLVLALEARMGRPLAAEEMLDLDGLADVARLLDA